MFNNNSTVTVTDTPLIKMPKKCQKYIGKVFGQMAPGPRVPVTVEMDRSQRDLEIKNIWKYIERSRGVDWNLFGHVTVAQFPDGSLRMINGQHRTELVKWFAPDIKEVPAHHLDLTHLTQDRAEVEAARYFAEMNGLSSRSLSSDQLFWSRVIGLEQEALYHKSILERANLSCGKVNDVPGAKKVKYNNFVQSVKMGAEETIRAAELIQTAYPKNEINDVLLSGMTRLFSHSSYTELMDESSPLYAQFEVWFTTFVPQLLTISNLSFRQYRNTHKWHDGVAYGLYKMFAHYQRNKNRWYKPIDAIKQNYEKGIQLDSMLDD